MKKVAIIIGAVVLAAVGIGGYLHVHAHKKAAPVRATAKPVPPPPVVHLTDKSDDFDRVYVACGVPRSDHAVPDTTKTFAGGLLRTVDYSHDDPKLGHVSIYLSFDKPSSGWRFRGASKSLAATDRDLTIDELRISLPCAANTLENEASSDSSESGDGDASSGSKTSGSNAGSTESKASSDSRTAKDSKAPSDSKTPSQDKAP